MKAFSTLNVSKNILQLGGLKFKLKSVYSADFAKESSHIQKIEEIIRELEQNQAITEVTKSLRLILTIPGTSASCENLSFSLK